MDGSIGLTGSKEIDNLGLWGNYTIPRDNPYIEDAELSPEIWAMGFKNPWRCSFDSERAEYFFCADVGQVRKIQCKSRNSMDVIMYCMLRCRIHTKKWIW